MRDYTILDHLEEGIQIISSDMKYIYLNKALLQEIQMKVEDIIGYRMEDKFPGIEHTEIYKEITNCIQDRKLRKVINEFQFPDGRQTFYELEVQSIPDGVIIFSRDITNSKKGESLLLETNKELENFSYILAHSLREPLKHIGTYSDLLLSDYSESMPQEAQEITHTLLNKAELALQLINSLRKLSGIGDKKLIRTNFSIIHTAQEVARGLTKDFPQSSLEVPQSDYRVFAFSSLILLLFRNLLVNVFRYGSGEVKLTIDNSSEPIFCISCQIKEISENKNIFQFSSFEEDKQKGNIELSICKKVIQKHQGKIWSTQSDYISKIYFTLGKVYSENE